MKNVVENYYQEIKKISYKCAIISFGLGTFLLLLFILTKVDNVAILGYFYVVLAFTINTILFFFNLLCAFFTKNYRNKFLINSGILLINVPIALFYLYLMVEVLGF